MELRKLLQGIPVLDAKADLAVDVQSICYDSRKISKNSMFIAISGFCTDGNRYIAEAFENGAVVVVTESVPDMDVPYILVEDVRYAMAMIGRNLYGDPAKDMVLIGVTGTNGKTSVTMLLKYVLEKTLHNSIGLIGTVYNRIGEEKIPSHRTTPESLDLQKILSQMRSAGCSHVVMEVSSHAIALQRIAGLEFAVAAFTNLSEDHLDFHRSMEEYCQTKAALFRQCRQAVMNMDDPWGQQIEKQLSCPILHISEKCSADLSATNAHLNEFGVSFTVSSGKETTEVHVPIPGNFTVQNALCVMAIASQLGISLKQSARALAAAPGIPGRMEIVPTPGKPYTVMIDYAHTPDGLEKLLTSVGSFCKGNIILVFGCGGNRDRGKRSPMGKIAGNLADYLVITSDNPRFEQPMDIIKDILSGMDKSRKNCKVIENREKAIGYAMDIAKKHDIIILAGKGHETYQEIRGIRYPLDEREIVRRYLHVTEE